MKASPTVRFWVRQLVTAAVAYLAVAFAQGHVGDWSALGWGLAAAVASTVVGLLGPHEPFVGIKYGADVPVPPAEAQPR